MTYATHLDLYQLTSLVPHWDAGRAQADVWMSFFSRRLPRDLSGQNARGAIVWAGLQRCLTWLSQIHFDEERIDTLCAHPMLGPALRSRPELVQALRMWRFRGEIWAPDEGELLWAGRAHDLHGNPVDVDGVKPSAMPPYLQIRTDLLSAKLIETPLLSIINHMSMVATKSAHLCVTAGERSILEFGSRRTHIEAAIDAAVAAYIGGSAGTSNVEAHHRFGVPVLGTMDHFAVQSWEQDGRSVADTERGFFEAFIQAYPERASLLVDTYDMFGAATGIRNAAAAANQAGVLLHSIRIDSALSPSTISKARHLLDELKCYNTQIIASGGVDEPLIIELADSAVNQYGVGERLVSSADAPVGVGAVGKLCWIEGQTSMKRALGSGKATLPGPLQAFRSPTQDRLVLVPAKQIDQRWTFAWDQLELGDNEKPLIRKVWENDQVITDACSADWLQRARSHVKQGLTTALSLEATSYCLARDRFIKRPVRLDPLLVEEIERRCRS